MALALALTKLHHAAVCLALLCLHGWVVAEEPAATAEAFSANFDDMNLVKAQDNKLLAQAWPKRQSLSRRGPLFFLLPLGGNFVESAILHHANQRRAALVDRLVGGRQAEGHVEVA